MSRLTRCFQAARRERRAAFIGFTMAGDPSLPATRRVLRAFEQAGVDIIELGVPFSDPLADGPTIQAAAQRALRARTNLRQILALVARYRRTSRRPVVLLSYLNPLMAWGGPAPAQRPLGEVCRPFLRAAARAGVDGIVIPDLPVDDSGTFRRAARQAGIAWVPLAAPTSSPERLVAISRAGQGFIYYVSVTGTTGARRRLPQDLLDGVRRLQRTTRLPVCVGFGIATTQAVRTVAGIADGVIVGSAIIERWHRRHATAPLTRWLTTLVRAAHRRRRP